MKAVHDGVAAVHEASIRDGETAGTTMCSLFLLPIDHQKHVHSVRQSSSATAQTIAEPWQPSQADVAAEELGLTNTAEYGQSYKVICANVGDSRCVMVGCSAESVPLEPSDFETNLRSSYVSGFFSPKKYASGNDSPNSTSHVSRGLNVFAWGRASTVLKINSFQLMYESNWATHCVVYTEQQESGSKSDALERGP